MKALVPILGREEWRPEFINKALEKAGELVLLSVIDRSDLNGKFGFAATEIMQANKIMEGIETELKKMKVKVESIVEWGNTALKIDHIARLKKCDFIFLKKQKTKYFTDLVKELEKIKDKKIEMEVI
jgi:hypothetical protein